MGKKLRDKNNQLLEVPLIFLVIFIWHKAIMASYFIIKNHIIKFRARPILRTIIGLPVLELGTNF